MNARPVPPQNLTFTKPHLHTSLTQSLWIAPDARSHKETGS